MCKRRQRLGKQPHRSFFCPHEWIYYATLQVLGCLQEDPELGQPRAVSGTRKESICGIGGTRVHVHAMRSVTRVLGIAVASALGA